MADVTLTKSGTVSFNSTCTLKTDAKNIYIDSNYNNLAVRAVATGVYSGDLGAYVLGNAYIEITRTGFSDVNITILGSSSNPSGVLNVKGDSFSLSAGSWVEFIEQKNIKSVKALGNQVSTTIYLNATIRYRVVTSSGSTVTNSCTINSSFTFTLPDSQISIEYYKNTGELYKRQTTSYNSPYTIIDTYPSYNGKGYVDGKYTVTFNSDGGGDISSKEASWKTTKVFSSWSGYSKGSTQRFKTNPTELTAQYVNGETKYGSVQIPSCSKQPTKIPYTYNVTFYKEDDIGSGTWTRWAKLSTAEGNQVRSYSFNGWKSNIDSKIYNSGDTYIVTANTTMTAQWSPEDSDKIALKLQQLPSEPFQLGYTFKGWTNSSSNQIKVGSLIDSDTNAYSNYEAKEYTVQFVVNGNKRQEYSYDSFIKKFDEPKQIVPGNPLKTGYNFKGWSSEDHAVTPLFQNQWMNDDIYRYIYALTGSQPSSVKLYAWWDPIYNNIKLYYWVDDSKNEPTEEDDRYCIEDIKTYDNTQCYYIKYAPELTPQEEQKRGEEYVFIGWCRELPENFYSNDPSAVGYHGIYDLADLSPNHELPYIIKKSDITDPSDWDSSPAAAKPVYGIWSKTGKYVKLESGWKKANMAYVKVNGAWKPVHDFYTCIQSAEYNDQGELIQEAIWKHEV